MTPTDSRMLPIARGSDAGDQHPTPARRDEIDSQFLARLLDQTSQPFLAVDLEGNVLRSNRAFEELLGYTAEDLRATSAQRLTPPEHWSTSQHALDQLALHGKAERYEKQYLHRDGRRIPVALVTDFFRDENGAPQGYYAFITDISERVRAEALLRESEERFRRLYDEAPVGYHELDAEGRIVTVNLTECEILGYRREEMLGRSVLDFVDPESRLQSESVLHALLRGDEPAFSIEQASLKKDGSRITLSVENRLKKDPDGRVLGIRSTVRDISRRKRAEEAAAASDLRARVLFEGIEDSVFVHDMDGRILDANPAACQKLGYTREEFLALTTRDIDDPEFAAGFGDRLDAQMRAGHLRCDGQHRTKDGRKIPVEINTSTAQVGNRKVVIAVIRDISERKALEDARRLLEQSDKLASIGLLSAGVAHEINNPLSYIGNNLAVLERDIHGIIELVAAFESAEPAIQTAASEQLERIRSLREELDWEYVRDNLGRLLSRTREGVQRVANIVNSLRTLARTAPLKKEPAYLPDLVASAVEMVHGRIKRRGIALAIEHGELPRVACVPSQISQVVLNLVVNAVQSMETYERPEGHSLRITISAESGRQTIEITDTGSGIARDALPRLFDPFYTTKPVGEGTGLGLSISHGIVTGHGGTIEVASEPGQGATFRITLPAADH